MTHDEALKYARPIFREIWTKNRPDEQAALREIDNRVEGDTKLARACLILEFRHLISEQQTRH